MASVAAAWRISTRAGALHCGALLDDWNKSRRLEQEQQTRSVLIKQGRRQASKRASGQASKQARMQARKREDNTGSNAASNLAL
eukprot:11230567-Alexandrium_andersonii.AAC.1